MPGAEFQFGTTKGSGDGSRELAQQCEGTECCWSACLKIVKMVNLMGTLPCKIKKKNKAKVKKPVVGGAGGRRLWGPWRYMSQGEAAPAV